MVLLKLDDEGHSVHHGCQEVVAIVAEDVRELLHLQPAGLLHGVLERWSGHLQSVVWSHLHLPNHDRGRDRLVGPVRGVGAAATDWGWEENRRRIDFLEGHCLYCWLEY